MKIKRNEEIMTRNIKIAAFMILVLIFTGCGNKSVSDNVVTMADEMATEISENAVPVEAAYYSSVSFDIPEGMVPSEENTDVKAFYLAEPSDDYSFISYQRRDNIGNITYDTMSLDDFRNAFIDQIGVSPRIMTFIREDKGKYSKISIDVNYSVTGIDYTCNEYVFITDKYIITLVYCLDEKFDWKEKYDRSVKSISVESVAGNIIDRITPAQDTIEEIKNGVIMREDSSVSESNVLSDVMIQE